MVTLWVKHEHRYELRPTVATFLAARQALVYDLAQGRGLECHLTRDEHCRYLAITGTAQEILDLLAELRAVGVYPFTAWLATGTRRSGSEHNSREYGSGGAREEAA